jgi:hypothetical protein
VTISSEGGSQTINVQATDMSNNVSTLTLTLNLDFTPPTVAFAAAPPTSTGSSSVTLSATIADALSGINAGYCNGQVATVASGTLSCAVNLHKGHNAVFVEVFDVAGNATVLSTLIARTGAANALKIQPEQLTLLVNDERPIQVVDDAGQVVTTPFNWTSTDTDLAHVDTTNGNVVVATGTGGVTLTASDGALSASIDVTVLAGTSVTLGSAVWAIAPLPDGTFTTLVGGAHDGQGPTILAFASPSTEEGAGTLLALGPDGSRKWDITVPDTGWSDLIAMPDGGALLPVRLTRVGRTGSGVLWRARPGGSVVSDGWTAGRPAAAVGPDGTVVAVLESGDVDREVVSLAAETGAVQWRVPLGHSSSLTRHVDCSSFYPDIFDEFAAQVSGPVIDDHGTAFVFVKTSEREFDCQPNEGNPQVSGHESGSMQLLSISSSGSATWSALESYDVQQTAPAGQFQMPSYTMATGRSLTPVTGGGALAIRNQYVNTNGDETPTATIVSTHGTDSDMSFSPGLDYFGDVLLGEDHVAYGDTFGEALTGLAFDVRTGSTLATFPGEAPGAALAGGCVLWGGGTGWTIRDASGTELESAPYPPDGSVHVSGALWVSAGSGSIVATLGLNLTYADSPFPVSGGVGRTSGAGTPSVRNFSASTVIVKSEECSDGFQPVDPLLVAGVPGNHYGKIDGIKPPSWNGDWLKVSNGFSVNIESNGDPLPYAGLLVAALACWQNNPSASDYVKCGGRKVEPEWSLPLTEGGKGAVDWKYPRPAVFDCGPKPWWKFW